eukprot:Skav221594  [mRNA]  locus=scaffold1698:294565:300366:+ [translate_table: standard]
MACSKLTWFHLWDLTSPSDQFWILGEHPKLEDFDRLVIYTDGSALPQPRVHQPDTDPALADTWAFLVLGEIYATTEHIGATYLVGWTSGFVDYDSTSSSSWDTKLHGSDQAETEALLWAHWWRILQDVNVPTTFVSDSNLCVQLCQGHAGLESLTTPGRYLRALCQVLVVGLSCPPSYHHTYGHQGDPWNEIVDRLTQQQRVSPLPTPSWPSLPGPHKHILPHFWLALAAPTWGVQLCDGGLELPPPQLPSAALPTTRTDARWDYVDIRLSCCTLNVNTLYQKPCGFSGKTAFVMEQLASYHLNVVGVQEARTPQGTLTSGHFLRFCSGAVDGHHGVELWVNLTQPYGHRDTQPLFFTSANFVIVSSDPTHLLAHCTADGLDLWFLVAHAPHTGRTDECCSIWWKDLAAVLARFVPDRDVIVLIDANATSGLAHDALPDATPGASRNADELAQFRDFLDGAFAAHNPYHNGTLCTWTSLDGRYQRDVDHILIPTSWTSSCAWSEVLEDVIVTPEHYDHKPLAVQMTWSTWLQRKSPEQPMPRYARDHIRQNDSLKNNLQRLPPSQWHTDIGMEVEHLNQGLHCALAQHCGRVAKGPRKAYVQPATWTLRTECLKSKKQLRHLQRAATILSRDIAFHQWRHGTAPVHLSTQSRRLRHSVALALHTYTGLAAQLRQALRSDKQSHLHHLLTSFTDETPAHDILKQLRPYRGSSNAKQFQPRPLPLIEQADGTPCPDYPSLIDRWVEFFCNMEGGATMTMAELHHHWQTNLQANQRTHLDFELQDVPTLCDLEQACARVRTGRAVGPDFVPPEVLRYYPGEMARLLYPQLLKLLTHGQESILHKGGRLVAVWKHKGSQRQCEMYRSLLISSHIGKVVHRTLRQHQASVYEGYLQTFQLGGRRGVPVTAASHQAKAFLRRCKRLKRPAAVAYLDLKEAYYRILRPLALGDVLTDEQLALFLARLQLPPDALDELRQHVHSPSAMEQAHAPPVLQRTARALHQDTHWWVDGQTTVCRTTQGSRPGDSWADVVFGYLWARLLKQLESAMSQQGVLAHLPACEPGFWTNIQTEVTPFMGPCWMDDLAVVVEAPTCEDLLSRMSLTMSLILDSCYSFGLTPNTARGKTELMVQLRGRGRQAVRRKLYGPDGTSTMPVVCEHGLHHIHVTHEYTHLGGIHHHSGQDGKDMTRRLALANGAFNANRRLIFHNVNIPLPKRVALFETLVLSKLLFGAETWVPDNDRALATWSSVVHRLYRRLLRKKHDAHLSISELLVSTGLPAADLLLRRARLRYLATLYRPWARDLWPAIRADQDWIQLCLTDLDWTWQQLRGSSDLPDPRLDPLPWEQLWKTQPRRWKGLLKRAFAHHALQLRRRWETNSFHNRIRQHLVNYDLMPVAPSEPPEPVQADDLHACLRCTRVFRSKQGLHAHLCRAHGRISAVRLLFDTTQCPHCLTEYHTAAKMYSHLYYSRACRRALEAQQMNCEPLPGRGSRIATQEAREHDNLAPVTLAQGPRAADVPREPPAPWFAPIGEELSHYVLDLVDAPDEEKTVDDLIKGVKQVLQGHPLTWQEGLLLLERMLLSYGSGEAEITGIPCATLAEALEALRDPATWNLHMPQTPLGRHPSQDLDDVPSWLQTLVASAPLDCRVPKPMPVEKIVLHLFSGRRRRGDVQDYVTQYSQELDIGPTVVVSVDVICDLVWGDVTSPATRDFWLQALAKGWIAATVAGPPCETWTIARHQYEVDQTGPRPVRFADALWGAVDLRLKELRQVLVGNELLEFALETFLLTWLIGHLYVLEHPEEPDREDAASIWRQPILQFLLRLPGVRRSAVQLGLFGAPSSKPTCLVHIAMPAFEHHLAAWQLCDRVPAGISIGKGKDGSYLTARLKEYPPALCRGIAWSLCTSVGQHRTESMTIPNSFMTRCTAMQVEYGEFYGADFAAK